MEKDAGCIPKPVDDMFGLIDQRILTIIMWEITEREKRMLEAKKKMNADCEIPSDHQ